MKRKALAIIILVVSFVSAFAQVKQSGYVKQYNEKLAKTPLGGVELNMYGAASTVSDSKGAFTLSFNTLKAGDKIGYSKIAKAGYVLFNKDKLDQWNISKDNKPFTIIMCQESKFKAIKDNYLKVSSASYARQRKKEEAALEAKYKSALSKLNSTIESERNAAKQKEAEYRKELNELRQYYAEQLKNIDTYVDQFSRIDLSELCAEEQAIIDLIQAGDIESAINRYEKLNYLDKYEKEIEEVKALENIKSTLKETKNRKIEERDSIFRIVNRQIKTYRLAGGKDNFDKASKLLRECADADTTNLDVVWTCADFLYDQKDFYMSLRYYHTCYNVCNSSTYRAAFNCYLGRVYSDLHNYQKAEVCYLQSLDGTKALFKKEPGTYRWQLASVQNNLGLLYDALHKYKKGKEYLLQSLENYQILFDTDSVAYKADLADTQNNVGLVYYNLKDYKKSLDFYKKGFMNFYDLFQKNPNAYRVPISRIESNLGLFMETCLHDLQKSEACYLEALANWEILYENNPDAYRFELATVQNNLGTLYLKHYIYEKSEKFYFQSIANKRILFQTNPDAYRDDLATSLCNLAILYLYKIKYDKSLELYRDIINLNPNYFKENNPYLYNELKKKGLI